MDFGKLFGDVDLEQVQEVLSLVTEHKDALAKLGQLPEYLGKLADGLAGAGDQARSASLALVGEDGSSGVRQTLAEAGAALGSIVASVGAGAERLADAAASAGRVPLMDGPAERLAGAAGELSSTTEKLGELGTAMGTIADTLGQVGEALKKLGEHLDDSGAQARGFADLG
jgi:methyl-accepting chemotaxis protein